MLHRPFHRVLGETSLELKCLTLFGAFLLLVITASFLSYWLVTETVVEKQNPNTGRLLVNQVMLITHWKALEKSDSPSDEPGSDDFLLVVDKLTEKLRTQNYNWRFISPDPSDEGKQPENEFERRVLDQFLKAKPSEAAADSQEFTDRRVSLDGKYEYYQPIRAEKSCLRFCHRSAPHVPGFDPGGASLGRGRSAVGVPLTEGDLLAVVEVNIPNGPVEAEVSWYWNTLLAVAIVTTFLAMIAFYVTIRYLILHPLKHLRDVSDAISRGNIAMKADIHTGDEFEALSLAFNRMLRHLVTIQDDLRQVNVNLDLKVDELARVNMQLYEMNRVKSDFLATMSHELRTPLNSILGFSDVLGSIASLDDKQKRYVQNIQKSGRLLLDMINNILDLAKIEAGKMELRLTDFSVEQVIHAQCDMARPLSEKKNIDLDTAIQPDLPLLYQDQARVQQILNNLISNAIKFTPEGGRIMVAAERTEKDELVVRVTDTGVGIAEEDQQIIFEKFRQGSTSLPGGDAMTREYSGTGLGLSIVMELCKLLQGEVSVQSQLGTGSTFTVRLPWRLEAPSRLDSPLGVGFEATKPSDSDTPQPAADAPSSVTTSGGSTSPAQEGAS